MKYLFAAVLVAGTVAGFSGAADAAGGCGPGWHRGPYGGCHPNRRVVVVGPRLYERGVVGPRGRVYVEPRLYERGVVGPRGIASSSNRACTSGALSGRVGACERRLNQALRRLPPGLRTAGG